jgi:hypothetical protein
MRNAPKRGHIEQSLVLIDRINPPEIGGQAGFFGFFIFLSLQTRLRKYNPAQRREKGTWLPPFAIFKLNS